MKPLPALLVLLLLATVFGKDAPLPAVKEKPLELEPLEIRRNAIISFAIDIVIHGDPDTKLVNRIFITRVLPDTDAEKAGLQEGDEIVKLDGVPVKGMDPFVVADSQLGRLLLSRDRGEALKLEVITHRTQVLTLRAQRGSPLERNR